MESSVPCYVCASCLIVYRDGSVLCALFGKQENVGRCFYFRSTEVLQKLLDSLLSMRKEEKEGGKDVREKDS